MIEDEKDDYWGGEGIVVHGEREVAKSRGRTTIQSEQASRKIAARSRIDSE